MKKLVLSLCALLFFFSCEREEYSGIPYAPVNYLLQAKDMVALSGQACLVITDRGTLATNRIGYGGLLVVHGPYGDYYAFDLACPVEAKSSVRLELESSLIVAVCPSCGARYDISTSNGFPIEGSKYRLTPYQVIIEGSTGRVVN